jgi:hypothetical protein
VDSLKKFGYLRTKERTTDKGKFTVYLLPWVFLKPGTPPVPTSGPGVPAFSGGVPKNRNETNIKEPISKNQRSKFTPGSVVPTSYKK